MNILLGVTGCIAAYKAAEVCRGLQKAGHVVRVTMTQSATEFVGEATFAGLTGEAPATSVFNWGPSPIPHVELGRWADLMLVCPCTANTLAKLAWGLADDCLTSCALALTGTLAVAPAMNVHMWQNPATQRNLQVLEERGVHIIGPDAGRLACGEVGQGKLAPVDGIVQETLALLGTLEGQTAQDAPQEGALASAPLPDVTAELANRAMTGAHVLITAGPTHEPIDPVRYISNRSSGKMGYALAQAARAAGAQVTLVSGPVSLPVPVGVECIQVETARQMYDATMKLANSGDIDVAICAAAVADYTPVAPADHKLKKSEEHLDTISLKETHDILAELAACQEVPVVIGFAAETNDLVPHATQKLESKGCDLIVANDVSRKDSTFGASTNAVTLVWPDHICELPLMTKDDAAASIIEVAADLLAENNPL
ncbi:bifunctional phosphopantothenoylcysteine decarboxylase/phosphopantothenate--cysteine ligase CoaBC [Olsenella sp. KGMB02461]|nr:bifunctional phosphopantothenoylcysteine decarboxylase/phosphopantothenate--cysteine ligase CoaBC [Olsenella sp. KGMB02461]